MKKQKRSAQIEGFVFCLSASCYFTAAAAGDDDDGTSSLHSNVILQHLHTASHFAGLQLSCT